MKIRKDIMVGYRLISYDSDKIRKAVILPLGTPFNSFCVRIFDDDEPTGQRDLVIEQGYVLELRDGLYRVAAVSPQGIQLEELL